MLLILAILLSPFVYFMVLYANYELLFTRLNIGYEESNKLKSYAKRKIIRHCLLSLKKVKKSLNMNAHNLMCIRNKKDVDKMCI